jgi:putative heme-binding domain-containing protein
VLPLTTQATKLVQVLDDLPKDESVLARTLTIALFSKMAPGSRVHFKKGGRTEASIRELFESATKIARNEKASPSARAAAIRSLSLGTFADQKDVFLGFLSFREPEAVQLAALETLSRFDQPAVAGLILDAWPGLSPKLRASAAETLFARPAWVSAFLDSVEKGSVKVGEVDPARLALLKASAEPKLKARVEKLLAANHLSKRADVVAAYRKALDLTGEAGRGKEIFKKTCATCHRLEGVGEVVGPDLASIRNKGSESIILNVLDPNREVLPQYLAYYAATTNGRTLTGLLTAETATSITLRRPDATTETLLRVQIEDLRSTGISFMPEGLEQQVDVQAMADLLAYLNSIK